MRKGLRDGLLNYLKNNNGWHKKVVLYIIADELGYSPESGARALRTLAEEGKIKVDYYDGKYAKGLAMYSFDTVTKKPLQKVVIENGIAKLITYYE